MHIANLYHKKFGNSNTLYSLLSAFSLVSNASQYICLSVQDDILKAYSINTYIIGGDVMRILIKSSTTKAASKNPDGIQHKSWSYK